MFFRSFFGLIPVVIWLALRGQLREGNVEHFQVGMKVGFRLEDA